MTTAMTVASAFGMPGTPEIIVLLCVLCVLGLPLFVVFGLLFLFKGKGGHEGRCIREEQQQDVREILGNLDRMQKRIESLETILVDEMRKERDNGNGF